MPDTRTMTMPCAAATHVSAAILSMQRVANYGSFLQAWALRELLRDQGCHVSFADYHPGRVYADQMPQGALSKAAAAARLGANPVDFGRYLQMKQRWSRDVLPLLGITGEPSYAPECDLLVLGSDEVWNVMQPSASVGMAPELFGIGNRAGRVVSYAASFGSTTTEALASRGLTHEVGDYLSRLDAVSVRDVASAGAVATLAHRTAQLHLDPVLAYDLLGRCTRVPQSSPVEGRYVLLYGYPGRFSEAECAAVRRYAAAHACRVVNIGGLQHACDAFHDLDPFEAVACFRGAQAIVTDTFHGTILSVLTGRPFATVIRDGQGATGNRSKLGDLVRTLGIAGHVPHDPTSVRDLSAVLDGDLSLEAAWNAIQQGRAATRAYLAEQVRLARGTRDPRCSYLTSRRHADCTGCGSCAVHCPKAAIRMVEDDAGFAMPVVNQAACVGCGRCLAVCPTHHAAELRHEPQQTVTAVQSLDKPALRRSSSGGLSAALVRATIEAGGVAYGAVASWGSVKHVRVTTMEEAMRIQGSVYAQSDLSLVWPTLEADAHAGTRVLFTGTPCQCAAVRLATGDPDNLVTAELVCEGTPSRRLYASFLGRLSGELQTPVSGFRFRDKTHAGWSTHHPLVLGPDGEPAPQDRPCWDESYYYFSMFKHALTLRESCYDCPFACPGRAADITMGDLWGAEAIDLPDAIRLNLRDGVSCMVVSSAKGADLVAAARDGLVVAPVPFGWAAANNLCLVRPSSCDQSRRRDALVAFRDTGAAGMEALWESWQPAYAPMVAQLMSSVPGGLRMTLKRIASGRPPQKPAGPEEQAHSAPAPGDDGDGAGEGPE